MVSYRSLNEINNDLLRLYNILNIKANSAVLKINVLINFKVFNIN